MSAWGMATAVLVLGALHQADARMIQTTDYRTVFHCRPKFDCGDRNAYPLWLSPLQVQAIVFIFRP